MQVDEYYDKVSNIYDSLYCDETSLKENNIVQNTLRNNINKYDRILDLGCGTGLFLEIHYNYNYIGIDCSEKMIEVAKQKYPFNVFIRSNIDEGIHYSDNMFDAVVSLFSSASHFTNLKYIASEIKRLLKNNGYIYIMVLAKKDGKHITYTTRNAPKELGNTKATAYTPEELKDIFKGFNNLKVYYLTDQKHTLVIEGKNAKT